MHWHIPNADGLQPTRPQPNHTYNVMVPVSHCVPSALLPVTLPSPTVNSSLPAGKDTRREQRVCLRKIKDLMQAKSTGSHFSSAELANVSPGLLCPVLMVAYADVQMIPNPSFVVAALYSFHTGL